MAVCFKTSNRRQGRTRPASFPMPYSTEYSSGAGCGEPLRIPLASCCRLHSKGSLGQGKAANMAGDMTGAVRYEPRAMGQTPYR